MTMIFPTLIFFSILFFSLNHPLSCGMILLLQTILIALITGLLNFNFWFSYIMFLIMIGGMLVLFIYMTSIASNEKFKFSMKTSILMIFTLFIIFMLMMMDNFYFNMNNQLIEMKLISNLNYYMMLNKYFNFPNLLIMLSMIIYLFLTLIAIVKITNFKYGPMRQKF
nr:NADH dehydrogenase subunit 6 [Galeruca sp. EMHAU-15083109]